MLDIISSKSKNTENQQWALQQWCNTTWPDLYKYIYYRVQNREEAEDVTQETYVRAFAKFSSPDNLPTPGYLKTIALNLIRDDWRRQKARGVQVPLEEVLLSCESNEEATINKKAMRDLMGQLPEDQHRVLQLRIIEGYSRAETAERMAKSEDAVRGLQYRAVQVLRNLMLKHFEEVEPR